jgi:hypothetical protein
MKITRLFSAEYPVVCGTSHDLIHLEGADGGYKKDHGRLLYL